MYNKTKDFDILISSFDEVSQTDSNTFTHTLTILDIQNMPEGIYLPMISLPSEVLVRNKHLQSVFQSSHHL